MLLQHFEGDMDAVMACLQPDPHLHYTFLSAALQLSDNGGGGGGQWQASSPILVGG